MTEKNAAQAAEPSDADILLLWEETCNNGDPKNNRVKFARALLSKLRAEGVQAGDEVEWAGYRPLLRDAIAAKDAMHEAGIQYAKFGVMFPEMMRRYAAALVSAPTYEPFDAELRIGVSATDQGATICIMQPRTDGTITVAYTETHPLGDSLGRAVLAKGGRNDE
ncbi:hypothetical protein D3C71_809730 [compost metagenome]